MGKLKGRSLPCSIYQVSFFRPDSNQELVYYLIADDVDDVVAWAEKQQGGPYIGPLASLRKLQFHTPFTEGALRSILDEIGG